MNACIITKYLGPTDTRGSRIQARVHNRTIILGWDYELDLYVNHAFAADHLAQMMGWAEPGYTAHVACGPDDCTYVHVLVFNSL